MRRLYKLGLAIGFAGFIAQGQAAVCSPETFGAHADGKFDNTLALQQAINACSSSGGVVQLGAGVYLTGPIQLKSHVFLNLGRESVIRAIGDKTRYHRAFIGWPFRSDEALITAYGQTDTGITGEGRIDGQGKVWWSDAKRERYDGTMTKMFPNLPDSNGMPRPWLIEFYHSTKIRVSGITLSESPMWSLALRYCDGVKIDGLHVENPADSPNTDGIDIVSSSNVSVNNATIATGDDNIAIKSGLAGFPVPAAITSNVEITNSHFGSGHGVSIGSETLNGVSQIEISHSEFSGTENGVRIKTGRDRGNQIDHIYAHDLKLHNVATALSVTAYYPSVPKDGDLARPLTRTTPFIHDIRIENLQAQGSDNAGRLIGLPEAPLKSVRLTNVAIQAKHGLVMRNLEAEIRQLTVTPEQGKPVDSESNVTLK
jgi:polygalacturonase